MSEVHPFQAEFDKMYITANEIQELLKVERCGILYAKKRGFLPDPIVIRGVRAYLWKREALQPYLDAWKIALSVRRGEMLPKAQEDANTQDNAPAAV